MLIASCSDVLKIENKITHNWSTSKSTTKIWNIRFVKFYLEFLITEMATTEPDDNVGPVSWQLSINGNNYFVKLKCSVDCHVYDHI
jgi:hypothetical protein